MDVIEVPGATGFIDTNYEGKADAAIKASKTTTSSICMSRPSTNADTWATSN
jgi:hypothetical protein